MTTVVTVGAAVTSQRTWRLRWIIDTMARRFVPCGTRTMLLGV